jgi:hypothetical protein
LNVNDLTTCLNGRAYAMKAVTNLLLVVARDAETRNEQIVLLLLHEPSPVAQRVRSAALDDLLSAETK